MPSFLWGSTHGPAYPLCRGSTGAKGVGDLLKDSIQTFNPSFTKIRQKPGRVEHAAGHPPPTSRSAKTTRLPC